MRNLGLVLILLGLFGSSFALIHGIIQEQNYIDNEKNMIGKSLCGDQEVIYLFDLKSHGDPNMHAVCRDTSGKLSLK